MADPAHDQHHDHDHSHREGRWPVRRPHDLCLGLRRLVRDDPAADPPGAADASLALAAAGLIGFVGNEIAARVRLRALAAAPQVGDHLDLHGESIVVHHVTRSARAGLAGVIVAGRP
jgi:hypothetical protein